MRFAIWDEAGGAMSPIKAGTNVEALGARLVRAKGRTLAQFEAEDAPRLVAEARGARGQLLEVHCHGEPGKLHLWEGVVQSNVGRLGRAVRAFMAPGARIELLACKVLAVPEDVPLSPRARARLEAVVQFFDRENAKWEKAAPGLSEAQASASWQDIMDRWDRHLVTELDARGYAFDERAARGMRAGAFARFEIARRDPVGKTRIAGLPFVQALARESGCTVRAGLAAQGEYGDPSDPIGNWEGAVYDVRPDGSVAFAGVNRPRRATDYERDRRMQLPTLA